jgi:hypothetical protein
MGWEDAAKKRAEKILLEAAPMQLLDRYGRPITEGCEVVFGQTPIGGVVVTEMAPVMDPRAPVGTMRVRLLCRYEFFLPKNQQVDWMRIRDRAELVAAKLIREREPGEGEVVDAPVEEGEIQPPEPGPKVPSLIQTTD